MQRQQDQPKNFREDEDTAFAVTVLTRMFQRKMKDRQSGEVPATKFRPISSKNPQTRSNAEHTVITPDVAHESHPRNLYSRSYYETQPTKPYHRNPYHSNASYLNISYSNSRLNSPAPERVGYETANRSSYRENEDQTDTELNLKNYTCSVPGCSMVYKKQVHLNLHMASHVTQTPPDVRQDFVNNHKKLDESTQHGEGYRGDWDHECSYCKLKFYRRHHLKQHIIASHDVMA